MCYREYNLKHCTVRLRKLVKDEYNRFLQEPKTKTGTVVSEVMRKCYVVGNEGVLEKAQRSVCTET